MNKSDIKHCERVCNEAIETEDNSHYYCIDDFIKDLQSISSDKRKLPLVMFSPNGMFWKPKIKMIIEDNIIGNDVIAMTITYQ